MQKSTKFNNVGVTLPTEKINACETAGRKNLKVVAHANSLACEVWVFAFVTQVKGLTMPSCLRMW